MGTVAFGYGQTYDWSATNWSTLTNVQNCNITDYDHADGWVILAKVAATATKTWTDLTGWTESSTANSDTTSDGNILYTYAQTTNGATSYMYKTFGASDNTWSMQYLARVSVWSDRTADSQQQGGNYHDGTHNIYTIFSTAGTSNINNRNDAGTAWVDWGVTAETSHWHLFEWRANGATIEIYYDGKLVSSSVRQFDDASSAGYTQANLNIYNTGAPSPIGSYERQRDYFNVYPSFQTSDGVLESHDDATVFDSGAGNGWSNVAWTHDTSDSTTIVYQIKCASSTAGLAGASYETIANSGDAIVTPGRYCQVKITMSDATSGKFTPVLKTLTLTYGVLPILDVTVVNPSSGYQGSSYTGVALTGTLTHWDGTTTVDFGTHITVSNITVLSATSLTCDISIDYHAATGARDVIATTGAEVATGESLFTVNTGVDQSMKVAGVSRLNVVDGDTQQKIRTQTGAWADPEAGNICFPRDGRRVLLRNTTQASLREYIYSSSLAGWYYFDYLNPTFTQVDATTLHTTTLLADHIGEHGSAHGIVFDNTMTNAGQSDLTTVHSTTILTDHLGEHTASHGIVLDNSVNSDVTLTRGASTSGLTRVLTIGGARNSSNADGFAGIKFNNYDGNSGAADYTGGRIGCDNTDGSDDCALVIQTNDGAGGALSTRATFDTSGATIPTLNSTTFHTTTILADHIGEHSSSHGVVVDNHLYVDKAFVTNDYTYGATDLTGTQNNLAIGDACFVLIETATGAITITGFDGVSSGRHLWIYNATAQNLTLAHDSASSTDANRIFTMTGADVTSTGTCVFHLIYSYLADGGVGKWILVGREA